MSLFPALSGPLPQAALPFHCRVVVLDKVTDLLLFFGKLLVVGGVGKGHIRVYRRAGALWSAEEGVGWGVGRGAH